MVGIIKQKKGEQYIVDIGTRDRVALSKMAFEGATKKYKPDLKVTLYAENNIYDILQGNTNVHYCLI